MKGLEHEVFFKVVDLDLIKTARAAAIFKKEKKEAASFIEQSLWYFLYDYMFIEKGNNIKVNRCELVCTESNRS